MKAIYLTIAFACFILATQASLRPRHKAPDFSGLAVMPDLKTETLSLSQFAGRYLVLVFYPFDFTYVCPTELISYSDNVKQFKDINTDVVAVSVDSQFSHLAWLKTPRNKGGVEGLQIPLISDITKQISADYGVLVEEAEDELSGASLRGLFIIDGKGVIRSMTINDAPVGRSVEETLRTVRAFQYTDEHGEVCPANWKPGARTIVPDQVKKIEFFGEL